MLTGKYALQEHLLEMDGLLDRLPAWLAGQYDPRSGGFYYAISSRLAANRSPDIESTAQALNMLERLGLLEAMPVRVKVNLIHYFKSRQEPESGYFYDDDPHMREDEVMVSRALGYSSNALRKLGAVPAYPLPDAAKQAPSYMRSPEAYLHWLQSVDLSNSWRGCDRLCCSGVYLKSLPELKRSAFAEAAFRFFAEAQDRDSGLWGEGSLYERISGTFKLHTFYSGFGTPMPRTEQMYASILLGLRYEEASDMCYIRNLVHLLSYIRPSMTEDELTFVLRATLYNMSRLLRSDGGFSRELAHSPSAPNVAQVKEGASYPGMPMPVHLSEGLVEGDMNAATQALLIRSLCYAIVDETPPKLVQRAEEFYDSLQ